MKKSKIISAALATVMLFTSVFIPVNSLADPVGNISGESGRFYEEINLSDGTKTGVRYTEMNLSGTYGSNKVLRLTECDLSNTNLSIDVINCGTYTVSKTTVATAAKNFSNNGKTVLAALNGDLWMTTVNSNSNVTKKTLQTTRGVMIIDREIWATQEFGMENYVNTSNPGTTASLKSAFGVTDENQPLVGAPVITVKVTNETKNTSLTADGINRLPAWDSLVVYNHRINSMNYALDDSYEIAISTSDSAFTFDGNVKGRVTAIYPSGSQTRPSIDKNTIILTARGSRVAEIADTYKIGDVVSFDLSVKDEYGNTDLWQNVVDAIGGHMQVIVNDKRTGFDTSSSEYPTSLIGIKDDGTVMFANINAGTNGAYKGLRFKDAYDLCTELGYNSVFYLDGGGSSSIVTLKNGTYTQRNYSADGSPRSVVNAVAMVWNDIPVCSEQGSLSYISTSEELKNLSPSFLSAGVLNNLVMAENDLEHTYDKENNSLRLKTTKSTVDPYIYFDLSGFGEFINTARYKYITLKLKTNVSASTNASLYYYTDAQPEIQSISTKTAPSSDYLYITFNMAPESGWNGNLTQLRLDLFEGITSPEGYYGDLEYIAFSKTPMEANSLKSGSYPIGSIKNYYAYKECAQDHSFELYHSSDSNGHIAECVSCGYSTEEGHKRNLYSMITPTCTENGSVVYKCSGCMLTMEEITINATGHVFSDEFVTDKEPTTSEMGQKSRHCMNCDEITDVTMLPMLTTLRGDVNCDGKVNGMDSNILLKYISGSYVQTGINTDVNSDGVINSKDSQILKRLLAGIAVDM